MMTLEWLNDCQTDLKLLRLNLHFLYQTLTNLHLEIEFPNTILKHEHSSKILENDLEFDSAIRQHFDIKRHPNGPNNPNPNVLNFYH